MTIKQIFDLAIKMGISADPRGKTGVKRWLNLQKKKFDSLTAKQKQNYDMERLTNPYADSRILAGNIDKKVKTIAAGIDIGSGEVALLMTLTANRLQTTANNKINDGSRSSVVGLPDLIISHHPEGKALAALDDVMHLQADMMASYGVPINIAEGVMHERIQQVSRSVSPANHNLVVDAANLAGIPLMCVHTPCDNLVFQYLEDLMTNPPRQLAGGGKPETVGEIIDVLNEVPEYKMASKINAGPMIFAGNPDNRAGRIVAFDMTGGTSGAKEIYPELARAGVGTIIGMHIPEESRELAAKNHLNIVIAGHISSDSLGMNLMLDELETKGVKILPIGGLFRHKRTKK